MWVSATSLVFWCVIGCAVGSDSIIKRDVSELIGKSDQSQLARTSSRLTNRYLPPQPGTEPQHTHHLVAPVDINSKSGDFEPATATSDGDSSPSILENRGHTSSNGIAQSGTNQLRAEFESSDIENQNRISASGSSNGVSSSSIEFNSSETDAPNYDNQNQNFVNGVSQTSTNGNSADVNNSQYETQTQISLNGEVTGRLRENGNGLILQNRKTEESSLNNRNSGPSPNYLPPQSQSLSQPISLSDKSVDVGTSYISPINNRPSEQLFTSSPESYTFSSSNPITAEQQLPSRSSELNSFSASPNPFKNYGPPSFQPQKSNYIAQRISGNTKDVETFQPLPTEQTKLAAEDAQAYNYRVSLQNGLGSQLGQSDGYASRSETSFVGSTPQLSQQKSQFGYDVQGTGNLNSVSNLRPDNSYRYFQSQNDASASGSLPVRSNYQQNERISSSSQLVPSPTFSARFRENQNAPHLQPFRNSLNELRTGPLTSVNGYRYQTPDLGIAVEAAGNQQISDYQRRPDLTQNLNGLGIASRLDLQIGVTPNLRSGSDSSYSVSDGAYRYVRPAIGLGAQNLEARFQPQSQPLGISEASQKINSYNQQNTDRGSFGIESGENLEHARLRSGSDSSYSISNGAYKYVRPAINLGAQNLETRAQLEVPQSQQLIQRVNTFDQTDSSSFIDRNGGSFGGDKSEDFSGQRAAYQQASGQNYDSAGGYVY